MKLLFLLAGIVKIGTSGNIVRARSISGGETGFYLFSEALAGSDDAIDHLTLEVTHE